MDFLQNKAKFNSGIFFGAIAVLAVFVAVIAVNHSVDLSKQAAIIGVQNIPGIEGGSVTLPGSNIQVSPSGVELKRLEEDILKVEKLEEGVKVEGGSQIIDVQKSIGPTGPSGTVKFQGPAGEKSVELAPGAVDITTSGRANISIKESADRYNISIPGTTVQIQGTKGDFDLMVKQGRLSDADKTVILNLEKGLDVLINDNNDLEAYNKIVVEKRPAILDIQSDEKSVQVTYTQPGKFLGIFNTYLNGKVSVESNGKVKVKLPWYSFLFTKNTNQVKKQLSLTLGDASASGTIQINALGSAGNEGIKQRAKVINLVTSAVNNAVSVEVATGTSPSPTVLPTAEKPRISSIEPSSAPVGASVVINGSGFSPSGNTILVNLGKNGTIRNVSSEQNGTVIRLTVPSIIEVGGKLWPVEPGTFFITVVNANNASSNAVSFVVTPGKAPGISPTPTPTPGSGVFKPTPTPTVLSGTPNCQVPSQFPYQSLKPNPKGGIYVGSVVNLPTRASWSVIVADTLNAGTENSITEAYVFDTLNLGTRSRVGTIYGTGATQVFYGTHATAERRINLSSAELIKRAMIATGLMDSRCASQ